MLIRIYPENPNEKAIAQVVEILQHDGVIIYPTDSVYAFGCSLRSNRAIERLRTLTGKQGNDFSIICADLSGIATYARVDNPVFKLMKRNLPGPFTFLLNASSKVPDKYLERKKRSGSAFRTTRFRLQLSRPWATRWLPPRSKPRITKPNTPPTPHC